jgi:hypothetical protein
MAINLEKLYELADEIKELRVVLDLNPKPANDIDAMEFLELMKTTPQGRELMENSPQFWEELKTDPRVQSMGVNVPNYWEEIQKDVQNQLNQEKSILQNQVNNPRPNPVLDAQKKENQDLDNNPDPRSSQPQDPALSISTVPGEIQQPITSNQVLQRGMEPRQRPASIGTSNSTKASAAQRAVPTPAAKAPPPAPRPTPQQQQRPTAASLMPGPRSNPFANAGTVNMSTINLAALFRRLPSLGAAASLLNALESKQPGASANMDPEEVKAQRDMAAKTGKP